MAVSTELINELSRLTTLPTTNLGTIMDIISKVLKEMMTKQEQVADDDEAGVG